MRLDNERNIGLVSLDIDGTLYPRKSVNFDAEHLQKTQQSVGLLRGSGVCPVLCTGKIIGYVEAVCEALGFLNAPKGLEAMNVAENGTVIFTYNKWPFEVTLLPKALGSDNLEAKLKEAEHIIRVGFPDLRFEYSKLISISLNVPRNTNPEDFYREVVSKLNDKDIVTIPKDDTEKLSKDSYTISDMLLQNEKPQAIREFVSNTGAHLFATHTSTAIDIVPYPFTKGLALAYVAAQKNIGMNSVVAFGDSPGDWTAFDAVAKYGGIPIAVDGAAEPTKKYVLERSGFVTLRPEPYGVFDCIDLIAKHRTVEGFRGDYKVACKK